MKKTTLEEFREELLLTGGYKTKDNHRAPFRAKPSALATLGFSFNLTRVFPLCAIYAIRELLISGDINRQKLTQKPPYLH